MKFGARFYGYEPTTLTAKAQLAEQAGYDSLWRGDHLVLPARMESAHPYLGGGSDRPFDEDSPILDVFLTLAFMASATSTIRLATGVFILPLRDVFATARAVQTLDVLSQGRVIFGIGVGWMPEEFEVVGRAFSSRGAVTDEAIEVMRRLWADEVAEYEGTHLTLPPVTFEPKPVQRPHPPLIFGGDSEAMLRRAARVGDGWYGRRQPLSEIEPVIARLTELRIAEGRSHVPFEITVRVAPDVDLSVVDGFEAAGVDRLVVEFGTFSDVAGREDLGAMERFASRVIARWQS